MKNIQQGFIGIVLIIVAGLAIGGGVYYHNKSKESVKAEVVTDVNSNVVTENKKEPTEDQKPVPVKKPVVLSFEAKARALAEASECSKYGTIGTALRVQEEYEYALFDIKSTSEYKGSCAVDMYKKTTVDAFVSIPCKPDDLNCHGTGLLLTPRKLYESIPVAPDPSTLR